jgi:hypothetical protein
VGPVTTTSNSAPAPAVADLPAAEHPSAAEFPSVRGRTLQQLGSLVRSSAQFGAATGTFTPGHRRLAFGVSTSSGAYLYAPTAVYISTSPRSRALGPSVEQVEGAAAALPAILDLVGRSVVNAFRLPV